MSGTFLGDYELGPVRGMGTVGTIYEATKLSNGESVAVKRLNDAASEDELIRARFRREMEVMKRLNHPNILRYYGGGDHEGQLYYAMELVRGGTVKDLLEFRGRFPWQMVVDITRQVASALQHAHNNGVVHRDLKPGNLLLTAEGDVKLGDFGVARDLQGADLTGKGMTVGTHAYMSPEQITGDQSLSGKADLYSMGCCVFEMLTGEKPFSGETYAQLFDKHLLADPPQIDAFVSSCPKVLQQMTYQLLAKKPADRPFNARQVQAVMLQLDEGIQTGDSQGGLRAVTSVGHEMLKKQIQFQMSQAPPRQITWVHLLIMLIVLVVIISGAFLLQL